MCTIIRLFSLNIKKLIPQLLIGALIIAECSSGLRIYIYSIGQRFSLHEEAMAGWF